MVAQAAEVQGARCWPCLAQQRTRVAGHLWFLVQDMPCAVHIERIQLRQQQLLCCMPWLPTTTSVLHALVPSSTLVLLCATLANQT